MVRHMTRTHRPLPPETLNSYIDSFLQKRLIYLECAKRFESPLYFLNETSLTDQIRQFRDVFRNHFDAFKIFYAMKSNSCPALILKAVEKGVGLDVSSGLELSRALSTSCTDIIFSGPGKTDEELKLALENRDRVIVMLDSTGELDRLSRLLVSSTPGPTVRTGIRIRNHFNRGWNKFGIPLSNLGPVLTRIEKEKGMEASGIQFHTSWNMDPVVQSGMIDSTGYWISNHISPGLLKNLRFMDIGGGYWPEKGEWLNPENTFMGRVLKQIFPMVTFENRHYYIPANSLNRFAKKLSEKMRSQPSPVRDLEIWTEPGRWISTPAMHIILKVVDIKDSGMVITDGGINLLGWERPLTEFIPVINLTRPSKRERNIKVFGSLCTPDDIWGRSLFGDGVRKGDILIIPDQGAYTYSLRQEFIKPVAKVIRYDEERGFFEMS